MSTSSDTTQPTLFGDESAVATDATFDISLPATESMGCAHITALLADSRAGDGVLNKYKTVVAWHARRIQDTSSPAKRRKVCLFGPWPWPSTRPTRIADSDISPLRSLRPHVIPATQPCHARSSVYPVPLQAAGRAGTSQATSTRLATLFVRPSHLRLRSRPNAHVAPCSPHSLSRRRHPIWLGLLRRLRRFHIRCHYRRRVSVDRRFDRGANDSVPR